MITPEIKELDGKLNERQAKLAAIFKEAGPDLDMTKVKSLGDSADVVAEINRLNTEMAELGTKRTNLAIVLKGAEYAAQDPYSHDEGHAAVERKSLGAVMLKSGGLSHIGARAEVDVEVKTLFQRSAGWTPESTRSGLLVENAQRPVQVTDLLPTVPTSQAAYKYMDETTFTNNAAERAEAGTYGEAALALTERSVTIETVGVWLPVTDEQLEDESGAEAYINQRLPFMIAQRLDGQVLTGDGTTPNVLGVNNKPSIQTQAKGADPVPDAIHKAITKVRVTGRAMPNAVIMHPNDWQDVRLLRTADGIYIWGSPSESGQAFIWGLPVVQSDAQTENTALVGDFANFSLLVVRRGLIVERTNAHNTDFINGRQAIRAGLRCATVWTRAAAFCTVTGI
jgi:HK97 family phage major capsid protein